MAKCPICKKTSHKTYKPFCSKRCADVDLGKWLNESYTIESEEPALDEESFESENS